MPESRTASLLMPSSNEIPAENGAREKQLANHHRDDGHEEGEG
jgi:hypothetical protein